LRESLIACASLYAPQRQACSANASRRRGELVGHNPARAGIGLPLCRSLWECRAVDACFKSVDWPSGKCWRWTILPEEYCVATG